MDKSKNKTTGNWGEDKAAEYLTTTGYKILERNLKLFCGEIDILAEDNGILVIVEVKTVRGGGWGKASDLVRFKKQKKLRLLALAVAKEYPNRDIRIDVIGIDEEKIEHIKNAVEG